MKYNTKKSTLSNDRIMDSLFAYGLYIVIGASCISYLRLTFNGPLIIEEGGAPFLYEFGLALLLVALLFRFRDGLPRLTRDQRLGLIGLSLFYVPIFFVYLLRSADIDQFVGGGQLRLQLEIWVLGVALICYPLSKKVIRRVLILVVLMALANGIYAILSSYGIVDPLYQLKWRIEGKYRYAGFFNQPSKLGVLSAIAITWALWLSPNRFISFIVMLVCGYASILADSRTGILSALLVVAARILSYWKIPRNLLVALFLWGGAVFVVGMSAIISSSWFADPIRLEALGNAVLIWMDNPFGIGWGTFDQFNSRPTIPPHNWPVVSLLYGGIFSFFAVVGAHIWSVRKFFEYSSSKNEDERLIAGLVLILLAVTFASWTEQVLQEASATFIYVLAFAGILHHSRLQRPVAVAH